MGHPTISVVMSIYNEPEEWLRDSIESILHQTFGDLEFIIVNDNPGRALNNQVIEHYMALDNRIVRIDNAMNLGLTCSLNIALREAKGNYIARMDGDDISLPDRLKVQHDFMEKHPDIGLCGCWISYFGTINLLTSRINRLPVTPADIKTAFLFYNPLVHPSVFFRKDLLYSTNTMYDEQFRNAQDYLLWENLLNHSIQLANINKVLLRYRVSNEQISNKLKSNQNSVANAIQMRTLEKMEIELSDTEKSLFCCIINRGILSNLEFHLAEQLLIKIRAALLTNSTTNQHFANKILHLEWVNCFKNLKADRKPWKTFFSSPLFQFRDLRLRDLAKIVLSA